MKRFQGQTFYELLEIAPSATPEEIVRAHERARALYGPGSLAAYTLLSPEVAAELARRIEEAREVLLDPQARASYDSRLPAEEARPTRPALAPTSPPAPAPAAPPAPAPVAAPAPEPASAPAAAPTPPRTEAAPRPFVPPEGAAWTGALLREAREARGFSVAQMADRTKLSRLHIECVEEERFEQLPAAVYLRGIVMCLARELRLDGQKVARSYMERAAGAGKGGR